MSAMTQAEFASHLGVTRSYVTLLKQNDRLILTEDGKINVEASQAKIAATEDQSKAGVRERHAKNRAGQGSAAVNPEKPPETDQKPDVSEESAMTYQRAKAVKERYNALQAKADYELFIGKLVDASRARAAGAELGILFRTALEFWPDTVGPTLVGHDEKKIRNILTDHVEQILQNIESQIRSMLTEKNK